MELFIFADKHIFKNIRQQDWKTNNIGRRTKQQNISIEEMNTNKFVAFNHHSTTLTVETIQTYKSPKMNTQ